MNLTEKAAYIKGLTDGLELDKTTKEGKILAAMLDVLSDIAENLNEVDNELNDIADVMTDMEESVADLEDIVYDIDDEDEDYDDDYDDFDDDFDDLYELRCPECKNTIRMDEAQAANGSIDCPNCGAHLSYTLEDDDAE